jgi:uncharacterized protein
VTAGLYDPAVSATIRAERLLGRVRRKLSAQRAAWQLARGVKAHRQERYAAALHCFAAAARAGNAEAQYRLGLAYARGEGVIRHPPDAVRWYRCAAQQGHLEAQFQLSLAYLHGQPGAAEDWYKAATVRHPQAAEWNRDIWFSAGISVPPNHHEALRWSRLAAEQGLAEAQANVGSLYLQAQDYAEARRWYELAAAQGSAEAEHGLGLLYANGLGVATDLPTAARRYALAASRNNDAAQLALGLMHVSGQGVERDPQRAAALFGQAASRGNARARHNLGLLYLRGEGLPQDRAAAAASFREAARLGYAPAMLSLGQLYRAGGQGSSPEMTEAVLWYKAAAAAENAEAQFILGRLYAVGEGVPRQLSAAAKWFEKAAEQGHAVAQFNFAVLHLQGAGVARDPGKAIEWYTRAAEQGFAAAQVRLAHLHLVGEGTLQDQEAAARWLERAVARGDSEAETALALLHLRGHGVPRDIARAETLLRQAAGRGHAPASLELGHLYSGTHGAETEAADWYQAAASAGHLDAQLLVAYNFFHGVGCSRDVAAAAHWLLKAAEQGHAGAQFQLGVLHCLGDGIPRDPVAAINWYRLAAQQGDRYAQHNLAEMLSTGDGVDQDLEEAVAWYRKAAEQGMPESEIALGDLHARGCGVARDLETAREWYEKAACSGGEEAGARLRQWSRGFAAQDGGAPLDEGSTQDAGPAGHRGAIELGEIAEPPAPLRLVIWDLDEIARQAASGDEDLRALARQQRDAVVAIAHRGIVSSVCSDKDPAQLKRVLEELDILDYLVFTHIEQTRKGQRAAAIIAAAELPAPTAVYIGSDPIEREEVASCCPGIVIADPTIVRRIAGDPRFAGEDDERLTRLARCKLLERRDLARLATGGEGGVPLRTKHPRVAIDADVAPHIDEAVQLINGTERFNFTLRRLPECFVEARQKLRAEISPCWVQAGLVRAADDDDDYGYCGFYWMVGGELLYYCFSRVVHGTGIESWLYQRLGRPPIVMPAALPNDLSDPGPADRIQSITRDPTGNEVPVLELPEVRLRGGGDVGALAHYLGQISAIVRLETDSYRAPFFLHRDSSALLLPVLDGASPGFCEATRRLGYVPEDFSSQFLAPAPPGSVLVYSAWGDPSLTLYRHREQGFVVPVDVEIYEDLTAITDEALADALTRMEIDEEGKSKIREIVGELRSAYTKEDRLPVSAAAGIMSEMFRRVPDGCRLFVILPHEREKWEGALLPRPAAIEYNDAIRGLARDCSTVTLLTVDEVVSGPDEVDTELDQFDRLVYFRLYERIMAELGATPAAQCGPAEERRAIPITA